MLSLFQVGIDNTYIHSMRSSLQHHVTFATVCEVNFRSKFTWQYLCLPSSWRILLAMAFFDGL